jgi:hypothetical protein
MSDAPSPANGDQLSDLLIEPQEDLRTEAKTWLDLDDPTHRAKLAKAVIALANYGGGRILVGFVGRPLVEAEGSPADLDAAWNTDRFNSAVGSYLDPPQHCEVRLVPRPGTGRRFPVVLVPGIAISPVRSKKGSPDNGKELRAGAYYVRRPGPKSEEPTPEDWDEILKRLERNRTNTRLDLVAGDVARLRAAFTELQTMLTENMRGGNAGAPIKSQTELQNDRLNDWIADSDRRWREVIAPLPPEDPARLPSGHYTIGYLIAPSPEPLPPRQLRDVLDEVVVRFTGWPAWRVPTRPGSQPRLYDNILEAFMGGGTNRAFPDPAHSDFWRAAADGRMFLRRGFVEDSHPDRMQPGTGIEIWAPPSRIGESLLHAGRLARRLDRAEGEILLRVDWSGLQGRRLTSNLAPEYFAPSQAEACSQDTVNGSVRMRVADIPADGSASLEAAARALTELLAPLYDLFDFTTVPEAAMAQTLRRLLGKRH